MKKAYVRPVMAEETFKANEYVATCYSGKCDVTCKSYYHWYDTDRDGRVDPEERGLWPISSNRACEAEFNEKGMITPVAWLDDGEWRTGVCFVAETPKDGDLSTHVSSSITKTNASQ